MKQSTLLGASQSLSLPDAKCSIYLFKLWVEMKWNIQWRAVFVMVYTNAIDEGDHDAQIWVSAEIISFDSEIQISDSLC